MAIITVLYLVDILMVDFLVFQIGIAVESWQVLMMYFGTQNLFTDH